MNRSVSICHSKSAELFQLKGWASELLILFFVFVLFQLSKLFIQTNLSSVLWRHLLYIQNGQSQQNGRHVSLGLKARLGLVSMITGEGFPKDYAENRIALINYFLFYVYLIHKNKQRVMSSPTSEVLPRSKYNREPCLGSIPATPGCSRDVSSRPSLRSARPAALPPDRSRPQRGGCSPRLGSGHPRGLQPTPGRAPTQAARLAHRLPLRPSRRPSRPGSVYKPLLAVPLSNASPRQPGSQTRTYRVPGREDRPLLREERAAGRGLT